MFTFINLLATITVVQKSHCEPSPHDPDCPLYIVQTLRTNELKVWTVLSTDDIYSNNNI